MNSRDHTGGSPDIRVIQRVAPYLWPKGDTGARIRVVIAMIALVAAKLATVGTPILYMWAVDGLTDPAETPIWLLTPVALVIAYGVARISSIAFAQLRDAVFAKVAQRALRRLALTTFRHVHALSLRYHITRKTGGLSRIIERGVKGVEFLLRFLLFSIGPLILELIMVAAIFFFAFSGWYLLIIVLTIAVYVWFTFKVTEMRVKIRIEMNDKDTDANQKAIDSLLNFETVKYFTAENREAARYDVSMEGYEDAAIRTSVSLAWLNLGQTVILSIGLVAAMWMAAVGVQNGTMTVGQFVAVNAYMIQLTMPLNFLGTVYREIRQSLVDMREMFTLLDQPPEVLDKKGASALKVGDADLRFEDIHFAYDPERQILKGIDITVPGGKTLAIVGPSGSGKSTISRLLFRFYDVGQGAIRIDGQDVRDISQETLRAAIGVVPQDTVLFNDTIKYNIAYGRDGASEDEIIEAAKAAQIHDFITALPEGYGTMVGERGLKLSGGEKQRVAIARTILKNPPILILDEATSALDSGTEREIQDSLTRLGADRTVLTIAHRLSTVVHADEIVVLDKGVIIERGRHDDLLAQKGVYATMWRRQEAEEFQVA
ncbi:MAG: ABC transporter ATP-binding protein/permease [Paracoccaceae bacterium]|nr:ABC transporter ATP-binding protein/permease [Paracoccaceae bacterium]MDG1370840.1 ABC transporter ATP-binding protein/permease [Paracoccaceae bacterium]